MRSPMAGLWASSLSWHTLGLEATSPFPPLCPIHPVTGREDSQQEPEGWAAGPFY